MHYISRIPYVPVGNKTKLPWGTDSSNPPPRDTITCGKCGKDTGIGKVLLMVIPPDGLVCPFCGNTVVLGPPQVTL